jgi:hypothetical protein
MSDFREFSGWLCLGFEDWNLSCWECGVEKLGIFWWLNKHIG